MRPGTNSGDSKMKSLDARCYAIVVMFALLTGTCVFAQSQDRKTSSEEILTNDSIIQMTRAGLSTRVIVRRSKRQKLTSIPPRLN
jgi:hypothetical protein